MLVAEQFVEIERRLRTAIACHRDEHFSVTCQPVPDGLELGVFPAGARARRVGATARRTGP